MKQILITGGAGFIGTHLTRTLLARGDRVTVLDNFITGTPPAPHERLTVLDQDVRVPAEGTFDEIYHLACPASPPHYQRDPRFTFTTSVIGTLNMVDLAYACGATLLFASTSEIYGDPLIHPQPESYWGNVNSIGIRSCYDEGKRAGETIMFDAHRATRQRIKVARIFNTYGPGMDPGDGRVVSNLVCQSLQGKDLTLYGDGEQTRSFCYVDDLVRGLIALMESPDSVTGPINLGNPNEFTILELAELVLELTGSASKLGFAPLPADDPRQRQPDIRLARELLGWEPKTQLRSGLERTIAYFRQRLKA